MANDEELQCRYYCLGFCGLRDISDGGFGCKEAGFDCVNTPYGDLTWPVVVPTQIEVAT